MVPDGMPDFRYEQLNGKSPAEYANTPGMDEILQNGSVALAKTMHDGLPLGSLVGIMGILGYNPLEYAPQGRSIFEAHALGVRTGPNDLITRCNIVRVNPEGILEDFTAGQISEDEAKTYLESIKIPQVLQIHHDLSYRNVLIFRDCPLDENKLVLFEPHENIGMPINKIMPRYQDSVYQPFADLILGSRKEDLMLWPWGAGRIRSFPPMKYRLLTVTALSFLYGMATLLGGRAIIPPGATGYRGSNLRAKLDTALSNLDELDVCLIHCNAPDEEAHINNLMGKVQAIEEIDTQIIRPLLAYLKHYSEDCRLVILPDHYTICETGKHAPDLVPFITYGSGIKSNHKLKKYSEKEITDLHPSVIESHKLIELHLGW